MRRMKWSLLGGAAVICSLMLFTGEILASSIRCQGRIISPGDRKYEVLVKCGEPDDVESREVYEYRWKKRHRGAAKGKYDESYRIEIPILIETWTYDFGPTRLIRYLHFKNDTLVNITTGERGYR